MRRICVFSAAGLLLAAAWFAWYFLRNTEEMKIRRTVDRLCRIIEYREQKNPALAALQLNGLDDIFCDPVLLLFRYDPWDDRAVRPAELKARVATAHRMLHALSLQISGLRITRHGDRAELFFSAELQGSPRNSREKFQEVRDIDAVMLRQNGLWKFQEMRAHDVLEH